jgi:uroporphyrinogen decarboxylase
MASNHKRLNTRKVLDNAATADVKEHVRERLEIFSQGGGFVFSTVDNIKPDVLHENIEVMFETIKELNDLVMVDYA